MSDLNAFLAGASVDATVFALRPDYRPLLVAVDGLPHGPSDPQSEALLVAAEAAAQSAGPPADLPHVAAWREAYRAFGAMPQRTRNSLETLLRRAESGLPRVIRLTGVYNPVSVLHQIPLGGEDLSRYAGSPRFLRAAAQSCSTRPPLELAPGAPHPTATRHYGRAVHHGCAGAGDR